MPSQQIPPIHDEKSESSTTQIDPYQDELPSNKSSIAFFDQVVIEKFEPTCHHADLHLESRTVCLMQTDAILKDQELVKPSNIVFQSNKAAQLERQHHRTLSSKSENSTPIRPKPKNALQTEPTSLGTRYSEYPSLSPTIAHSATKLRSALLSSTNESKKSQSFHHVLSSINLEVPNDLLDKSQYVPHIKEQSRRRHKSYQIYEYCNNRGHQNKEFENINNAASKSRKSVSSDTSTSRHHSTTNETEPSSKVIFSSLQIFLKKLASFFCLFPLSSMSLRWDNRNEHETQKKELSIPEVLMNVANSDGRSSNGKSSTTNRFRSDHLRNGIIWLNGWVKNFAIYWPINKKSHRSNQRSRCSFWSYVLFLAAIIWRLCIQFYSLHQIPWEVVPISFYPFLNETAGSLKNEHIMLLHSHKHAQYKLQPRHLQRQRDLRKFKFTSNVETPVLDSSWSLLNDFAKERNAARMQRTRPPLLHRGTDKNMDILFKVPNKSQLWSSKHVSDSDLSYPFSDKHHKRSFERKTFDWQTYCSHSGLNNRSRVVITGMLTIPVASMFALLLSKQCKVSTIIGVDPMLPNLQKAVRMNAMEIYQQLQAAIPRIQLIAPQAAAGYHQQKRQKSYHAHEVGFAPDWLFASNPTHIIHFEPHSIKVEENSYRMTEKNEVLNQMRRSLLSLEQLLQYVYRKHEELSYAKQTQRQGKQNKYELRFMYITTAPTYEGHGSSVDGADFAQNMSHLVYRLTKALIESYHSFASSSFSHKSATSAGNSTNYTSLGIPVHLVNLPEVFGPKLYGTIPQQEGMLHIDDAMAILLRSVKRNKQELMETFIASESSLNNQQWQLWRNNQILAYSQYVQHPYGQMIVEQSASYHSNVTDFVHSFHDIYGIQRPAIPCSSSCFSWASSDQNCLKTRFDEIIPISVEATKGCVYVLFIIQISNDVSELYQTIADKEAGAGPTSLCRIAFVSVRSLLVKRVVRSQTSKGVRYNEIINQHNGQLKYNGWTLIWLPNHHTVTFTEAERSLLLIDPSKLFADSVAKCMYTNIPEFAEPPDSALLRILNGLNRIAVPKHSQKVYRSGLKIFRFEEREAENARAVAFFAAEPMRQPLDLYDYTTTYMATEEDIDTAKYVEQYRRQLKFYEHAAYFLQNNQYRPESEIQNNVHDKFPYHFISNSLLIHDLQTEQARLFRCSWYNEHLFWNSNSTDHSRSIQSGTEGLSLAYLVGKLKIQQTIGEPIDKQKAWMPFLDKDTGTIIQNHRGSDVYLRFLTRPSS